AFCRRNSKQNNKVHTPYGRSPVTGEMRLHVSAMLARGSRDFESILAVVKVCVRWQQLCMAPCIWDNTRLIYFKLYSQVRASLISYCPNLTHLEISISQVDSCIFDDLGYWPNLKFLSFRNSLIVQNPEGPNETLILSNFALTHSSLYSMLQCVNLVSINMEKMKNIPADFLESLYYAVFVQ
ncbi:unnamed protein product, partial [Leptidea sinapis]